MGEMGARACRSEVKACAMAGSSFASGAVHAANNNAIRVNPLNSECHPCIVTRSCALHEDESDGDLLLTSRFTI
jgi:hypothetical protein